MALFNLQKDSEEGSWAQVKPFSSSCFFSTWQTVVHFLEVGVISPCIDKSTLLKL